MDTYQIVSLVLTAFIAVYTGLTYLIVRKKDIISKPLITNIQNINGVIALHIINNASSPITIRTIKMFHANGSSINSEINIKWRPEDLNANKNMYSGNQQKHYIDQQTTFYLKPCELIIKTTPCIIVAETSNGSCTGNHLLESLGEVDLSASEAPI